jgi:hypothetical protein
MHKALPPKRIAPSEQTTDETDHFDPKRQTEINQFPTASPSNRSEHAQRKKRQA